MDRRPGTQSSKSQGVRLNNPAEPANHRGSHQPPPTSLGPDPEAEAWAFVRDSIDPQDVTDFLAAYPASRFAVTARLRLRQLQRQTAVSPEAPGETIHALATGTPKQAPTSDALQVSPSQIRHPQTRLRVTGFAPGPIDGIFGPRTQAALYHYQVQYGLPATGRLDAATLGSLDILNTQSAARTP
jgi:hypothetical protein